jgi:hypothetical protein
VDSSWAIDLRRGLEQLGTAERWLVRGVVLVLVGGAVLAVA